ncbi:MAG: Potassium-transporting ATPase ATP-binding subunit [Chlamydiia bacterium]|nr:Potassium-transporting ATPase ATP-binding subunit [Chlamydiia bacterium]
MTCSDDLVRLALELPKDTEKRKSVLEAARSLFGSGGLSDRLQLQIDQVGNGYFVTYDPLEMDLAEVREQIQLVGGQIALRYQHFHLRVGGMDSTDCEDIIQSHLSEIPGVLVAKACFSTQSVRIEIDDHFVTLSQIESSLYQLGYTVDPIEEKKGVNPGYLQLILSLAGGASLLLGVLLSLASEGWGALFALISYGLSGFYTYKNGLQIAFQRRIDSELVVMIATLGMGLIGDWYIGGLALFLYGLGKACRQYVMDQTRDYLLKMFPAGLMEKTKLHYESGEVISVEPNGTIPADGVVIEGSPQVVQKHLSADESPVTKQLGDSVFAGSTNMAGAFRMRVSEPFSRSVFYTLICDLAESTTRRALFSENMDRIKRVYYPGLLIFLFLLWFSGPIFFSMSYYASSKLALSLLIAASPLVMDMTFFVITFFSEMKVLRKGIWVRSERALEAMSFSRSILFEQSGTVTEGNVVIHKVYPIEGDEKTILSIAHGFKGDQSHPFIRAVAEQCREKEVAYVDIHQVKYCGDLSWTGSVGENEVKLGRKGVFEKLPAKVIDAVREVEHKDMTPLILKVGEKWLGVFELSDRVREDFPKVSRGLAKLGFSRRELLSGDGGEVAKHIAKKGGLTGGYANLTFSKKVRLLEKFYRQGRRNWVVHDPWHDVPTTVKGSVSVLMNGLCRPKNPITADVVIMNNNLSNLFHLGVLSGLRKKVFLQNIISYLCLLVLLVILNFTGIFGMTLSVLAQQVFVLLAIWNAYRLVRL